MISSQTKSALVNLFKLTFRHNSTAGPTPNRLKDKVAIVTASTDGIGLAIAQRLASDGAKVVISSRKSERVEKVVKTLQNQGLTVHGIKCHVGSADDRKNLFKTTIEKFGNLDILVSNAATNPFFGNILECSEEAWDKIFDVNVKAAFLLARDAVPLMQKQGGGSIVFVSSVAGYRPMPMLGPYSISKTALLGLTKAMSEELAAENIRVNCLAPGVIKTRFSEALFKTDEALEAVYAQQPIKRLGEPSEMAGIVSFLVSDDASYVTGETIVAAGGMHVKL